MSRHALDPSLAFDQLRHEAAGLAGGPASFAQRASVHHHLYERSFGNHVFPLLAAHWALWARGRSAGRFRIAGPPATARGGDATGTAEFGDAIREIDRQVCIAGFTLYQLTARAPLRPVAQRLLPSALLAALDHCQEARLTRQVMTDADRRILFVECVRWIDDEVVEPGLRSARECGGSALKGSALRPTVRLSFLPITAPLRFDDLADREERIDKALAAFDRGARMGWDKVERRLRRYRALPDAFFRNPGQHFFRLSRGTARPRVEDYAILC